MQAGTRAAVGEGLPSAGIDEVGQVLTSSNSPKTLVGDAPLFLPHLPLTVPTATKQALQLETMMSSVVSEASGVILLLGDRDCNLIDAAFGPFHRPEEKGEGPRLWAAATSSGALILDLEASTKVDPELPSAERENDTSAPNKDQDCEHNVETRLILMALEVCNAVVINLNFKDVESGDMSNTHLGKQLRLICQCEREDLPRKLILCVRDWDPIRHHAGVMQSRIVPRFLNKAFGTTDHIKHLFNVITCLFTDPQDAPAEFRCAIAQLKQNVNDIQNHINRNRKTEGNSEFPQYLIDSWRGAGCSCAPQEGAADGSPHWDNDRQMGRAVRNPSRTVCQPPQQRDVPLPTAKEVIEIVDFSMEEEAVTEKSVTPQCLPPPAENEPPEAASEGVKMAEAEPDLLQCEKYGKKKKGKHGKYHDAIRFPGPYDLGRHGGHLWQRAGTPDTSICLVIMLQQQFLALQARFEDLQKESYRREAQIGQLQQEIQRIHKTFPMASCL